jgi:fructose-specific component phosphotransferase system IIB-like protein
MLGLVLSALLVPLPTVWGAMALKLGQFLKGLNVPTATISKIEKAFNSSEAFLKEKMARALPNKVKEKVESVLPIVEATRKE